MRNAGNRLNNHGNASATVIIVMALAVLMAIILGVQLGSGDYRSAGIWLLVGLAVAYVTHLHHYTWQTVMLLVFLGFSYQPFGFRIDANHIGLMLGGMLGVMYLMAPISRRPEQQLGGTGVGLMKLCMALWVAYGAIHFVWNHLDPYNPSQYAVKNALKTYVLAFTPAGIVLWFMVKPSGFRVGKNWSRILILLLFFSLVINFVIRLYYISLGLGMEDPSLTGGGTVASQATGALVIPVINLIPGIYQLRGLGPIAVAFGLTFLTSKHWMKKETGFIKLLAVLCVLLGLVGSVVSAGRASVIILGMYVVLILLRRKRMMLIMMGFVACLAFVAFVNVFSSQINERAPFFVQRSLQLLMFEKGTAMRSIDGSTAWRNELANRAYDEWRSDPRIFLLGRATYSFNEGDELLKSLVGGWEAAIQTSLRRGATHRFTSDCLLQYGLVGLILVYIMLLSILRFLYKLYRRQDPESEFSDLTFVLTVTLTYQFVLTFVTSTWMGAQETWLLVLLLIGYSEELAAKKQSVQVESSERALTGVPIRGV